MSGEVGWERGRGLGATQGQAVVAVELPDHLRLQAAVQLAAVLQAPPPPSLGAVAVLADPEPVSGASVERAGTLTLKSEYRNALFASCQTSGKDEGIA